MSRFRFSPSAWAKEQDGAVTVEFVVVVPFILTLFFASVDVGISMLRQVMLDRAVDMAVRQIRLGNEDMDSVEEFRNAICNELRDSNGQVVSTGMRSVMRASECMDGLAVELTTVDTTSFTGLDPTVQCVNREEDIAPLVAFTPGADDELMLIRVCVAADPFIRLTGFLNSMPINADGEYVVVSRGVFVNEPS